MATFLLLPGGGGAGWYWHRVAALIEKAGHTAIAVDFPGADEHAGLSAYADLAVDAAGARTDIVLVAQSMGGFTAPLAAARLALSALVFVNAMIPVPGETARDWWENVRSTEARTAAAERDGYSTSFDLATYFLHDVPRPIADELLRVDRDEAAIAFTEPCRFERWPDVATHVIIGTSDRLFPAEFQERVARERLGAGIASIDRVPGGHLVALAQPEALAAQLLAYV